MEKQNLEDFYSYFERIHRGSEELILGRLKFYIPLIKAYSENLSEVPRSLDIGCGRGEFVELFVQNNFDAAGVEINENFISSARNKGLNIIKEDALSFVRKEQESKYDIVSLIHVIEHLNFDYLFELFREIYRILKPGGSIIVETPYTKNIVLGIYNFWLDPTHIRPVNVELLRTLSNYLGFSHFEVFPLQSVNVSSINKLRLLDVFYSTSPDVSIVMIKNIESISFGNKILQALNIMKNQASVDLEELVEIYEEQISSDERIKYLEELLRSRDAKIRYLEESLNAILNSKLWRFYGKLSLVKNKIVRKIKKQKTNSSNNLSIKTSSLNVENLSEDEKLIYKRIKRFRGDFK